VERRATGGNCAATRNKEGIEKAYPVGHPGCTSSSVQPLFIHVAFSNNRFRCAPEQDTVIAIIDGPPSAASLRIGHNSFISVAIAIISLKAVFGTKPGTNKSLRRRQRFCPGGECLREWRKTTPEYKAHQAALMKKLRKDERTEPAEMNRGLDTRGEENETPTRYWIAVQETRVPHLVDQILSGRNPNPGVHGQNK
jgi:hypothetical protein